MKFPVLHQILYVGDIMQHLMLRSMYVLASLRQFTLCVGGRLWGSVDHANHSETGTSRRHCGKRACRSQDMKLHAATSCCIETSQSPTAPHHLPLTCLCCSQLSATKLHAPATMLSSAIAPYNRDEALSEVAHSVSGPVWVWHCRGLANGGAAQRAPS